MNHKPLNTYFKVKLRVMGTILNEFAMKVGSEGEKERVSEREKERVNEGEKERVSGDETREKKNGNVRGSGKCSLVME